MEEDGGAGVHEGVVQKLESLALFQAGEVLCSIGKLISSALLCLLKLE